MKYLYVWGQKASTITVRAGFREDFRAFPLFKEWVTCHKISSSLALILSEIFTKNLHDGIKCMRIKFTDHVVLEGEVDTTEWRNALWTEVRRLKGWVNEHYMKFNKKKFEVLYLWVTGCSAWHGGKIFSNILKSRLFPGDSAHNSWVEL